MSSEMGLLPFFMLNNEQTVWVAVCRRYPGLTKCRYKLQQLDELRKREFENWKDKPVEQFEESLPVVNIIEFLKLNEDE